MNKRFLIILLAALLPASVIAQQDQSSDKPKVYRITVHNHLSDTVVKLRSTKNGVSGLQVPANSSQVINSLTKPAIFELSWTSNKCSSKSTNTVFWCSYAIAKSGSAQGYEIASSDGIANAQSNCSVGKVYSKTSGYVITVTKLCPNDS